MTTKLKQIFLLISQLRLWRQNIISKETIKVGLSVLGAMWLLTNLAKFFNVGLENSIREQMGVWWMVAALMTLWLRKPSLSVCGKIKGLDVHIEVTVADMFDLKGSKIIPTNSRLETDVESGLISKKSVQGQYTVRNYDSSNHLKIDIQNAISHLSGIDLSSKVLPMGTTIKLDGAHPAYFVVMANLDSKGNTTTTIQNIRVSLQSLWSYISNHGDISELVIPIIGTGYARLPITKDLIIQEIVTSFLLASRDKVFTKKLTIAVHPADFASHNEIISDSSDIISFWAKHHKEVI